MSIFEIIMLVCFGFSWPVSIAKSVKIKNVTGKSPLFMMIVILGYFSGVIHKYLYAYDAVIYLYVLNMIMVFIDLMLYYRYQK